MSKQTVPKRMQYLTRIAVVLAFFVVMLGAFTRLTDAGLGCPDWPGCYGRLVLPNGSQELAMAQMDYPNTPIEAHKAWTEMIHRYAAGLLGLLLIMLAMDAFRFRTKGLSLPRVFPMVLLMLLFFQAALGMWTVTLQLLPIVVMGHLLGGMSIFACLCYLFWSLQDQTMPRLIDDMMLRRLHRWVWLGVLIVFGQIALGGWVSSNYAGIACIGFPRCNGQWVPLLLWSKAFNVLSPIGLNYQGGLLEHSIRATIQWVHRFGAYVTVIYVLGLSGVILARVPVAKNRIDGPFIVRMLAILALFLVVLQCTLGIVNVLYLLPLWVAVAHNGVAAALLATMVSLLYWTTKRSVV